MILVSCTSQSSNIDTKQSSKQDSIQVAHSGTPLSLDISTNSSRNGGSNVTDGTPDDVKSSGSINTLDAN